VVAAMLAVLGGLNIWTAAAASLPDGRAANPVLMGMTVVFLVGALGQQLMAFEDMTYELRLTNTRLEKAQGELREMVITDPLTGTRNRRFFEEIIGRELHRHRRYRAPLSIVFVDIDRFKAINDTLGHETGDRVLREVALFLLHNIREADYVFRWGGDEFVVLISCGEDEALVRARELQHAFSIAPQTAHLPPGVALSVGVVEVPPDVEDIMPLIQAADERMYANKKGRRA
jgi:diguanylate cyclase (GGDEF)-like protein